MSKRPLSRKPGFQIKTRFLCRCRTNARWTPGVLCHRLMCRQSPDRIRDPQLGVNLAHRGRSLGVAVGGEGADGRSGAAETDAEDGGVTKRQRLLQSGHELLPRRLMPAVGECL